MKRLRLSVFLLLAAIVCLAAPACNRRGGGKRVIAVIPKGVAHFFWQSVHAGAEAAGKEFGVEVMWKGPAQETDYSGQINIVEDAINRRVDGIVLAPSHGDALVPIVERAQREGIPVTIFDSGISTETYLSYVGQLVEITRATMEATRVLVMDEPTSSLTTREVDELFRLIRDLKSKGIAIVYISHRLEELESIADRLTILRDGSVVYTGTWGEIPTAAMIRHMAGRELKEIFPPRRAEPVETRLRVDALSRAGEFSSVTFEARAGEIVGLAGLAGAGRTELVETIFGARKADSGAVLVDGVRLDALRPDRAVARGLGFLTEDRRQAGLCLNLSLAQNLTLANVRALVKAWKLDRKREAVVARGFIERLHIRPANPAKTIARMSGGNQQKVLLGRWLFAESKVFLLDEPTRGVDVAARSEIYRAINELVEAGAAVVMISSDLPELLGMADRILVMRRGRLVAELDAKSATQEEVLMHAALEEVGRERNGLTTEDAEAAEEEE